MKNNAMIWIILGIIIIFAMAMVPWSGNQGWGICNMMGNWNYGSGGYGYGQIISYITNIGILIFILLGIIWLVKNISNKK